MAITSRLSYREAQVTFRFRNSEGALEVKTLTQDVTDEVEAGADEEHLVDRVFWNQINGKFSEVEIVSGAVVII